MKSQMFFSVSRDDDEYYALKEVDPLMGSMLEKLDTVHIETPRELLYYLDCSYEDAPRITANKRTLLVVDNERFNETYLLDVVNEALKDTKRRFDVAYLTNVHLKSFLFKKYVTDKDKYEFEKESLPPCLIAIDPTTNNIEILREHGLIPFEAKQVTKFIEVTKLNITRWQRLKTTIKNLTIFKRPSTQI